MRSLNERIGEVVKRKRTRDRLTQADLGSRIGVSGSYISAVEAGNTGVRITELEGLAAVFRTTAIEMINEAAGKDSYSFTSSNRERDAFMTLYDSLNTEHKQLGRKFLLFLRELELRPDEEPA
ncbi:helix-turn-helix domain-containing protein [Candidatus Viridilinea mediisalina]|uniref:Transcriptional regulator n=1 Tax=Candidatus Viridilinea mediisalina TaxID=2024553 RepID=A0A2A6RII0_9CHLR|nr:helix-turn-helix transcriptional regulator [Candidatus Viridilinea mediisalina]PDW02887.1 transcriptional regulator [Candidatus Viridilinea mediisalina]